MHYTAQPTDLPTLATLNESIDRAQQLLDATLTDLENYPSSSIEFRLRAIKDIIDCAYRLTAIRKTLIALRARPKQNANELRAITGMVAALHQQMQKLRPTPPPSEPGASTPPPASGTPPSPTAASTPSTPTIPAPSQSASPTMCGTAAPGCAFKACHADISACGTVALGCAPNPSASAGSAITAPEPHTPKHQPRKPRYSIKNLPTLNQLIPQATLPTPKPAPSQPRATVPHNLPNASTSQTAAILHHHATQQTGTTNTPPASPPLCSSFIVPSSSLPKQSRTARLFAAIAPRIPYSVYTSPENLPDTLPPSSHNANTYAPLLDLDLIPFVKSVPTLAITTYRAADPTTPAAAKAQSDLTTQINAHLTTITDKTINLRADLLHFTPSPTHQQHRHNQLQPEPMADPSPYPSASPP